jgi:hypothetical protein
MFQLPRRLRRLSWLDHLMLPRVNSRLPVTTLLERVLGELTGCQSRKSSQALFMKELEREICINRLCKTWIGLYSTTGSFSRVPMTDDMRLAVSVVVVEDFAAI